MATRSKLNARPRDFLTLEEFSPSEILRLLQLARQMKRSPRRFLRTLEGSTIAMIFDKSSTRTRVSFEVAMHQLGGQALFLSRNDLQLGRGEPVSDTARVLSRMADGIVIRTYAHAFIEEFAAYADVPVINALTDLHHPCQTLADLLTLEEACGKLKGLSLLYLGDGNNVAHSLLLGCAKVGMKVRVVTPPNHAPDADIVARARRIALLSGGDVKVSHQIADARKPADAVYTDAWASMGQEKEKARRRRVFAPYQVNEALMKHHPKAIFLHCLPAYRKEEVTESVLEGRQSRVWDQAENRVHAQKALLWMLLRGRS